MIDIHSHVLPDIDDGATSLDEAVGMCRSAAADGCTAILTTPHINHPLWPDLDTHSLAASRARLQARLGLELRVLSGAEIRVDSQFFTVLDRLHTDLADLRLAQSSYVLMEFDHHGMGPSPRAAVHEALLSGWRPVIAHPEVLPWLASDPDLVRALVDKGATLQITAASVAGKYGRAPRSASFRLLDSDLVHFVASDCHNLNTRPPGLTPARELIAKRYGEERAQRLFEDNPKALLEDRALEVAA